MSKIAIDVVLLPPENIMDKAIKINQQFVDDSIKLNKKNCLPHISLCMGIVDEKNLPEIKTIISKLSKRFFKLPLMINKIDSRHICFEIKKNKTIQKLHEEIMKGLSPYLSYKATTKMCFTPPPIVKKTLTWINNYKKTSFKNFYPHITLGISKLENKKIKINFTASKLAVCHLGNYCTCRKILFSMKLK
ncbi:MAG: hypothetical protein PHT51_04365 [Patescibacteria group bacterium]|nr:hypothetical protein [Patescibacteria group bacterium]MDD4610698.1 hypothetical protein [Patescibacteria group bacterium]